ncbi:hypothetical protein P20652_2851 [Pseudoalteromonas sp. BSi20652]|nr:hypothetical protein P20652_2851 [Pseudoalteromonas sp. BSi20652]
MMLICRALWHQTFFNFTSYCDNKILGWSQTLYGVGCG